MATFVALTSATRSKGESIVFNVQKCDALAVGVNVTAATGTSPTLNVFVEMLGATGVWYSVWAPAALTGAASTFTTIGPTAATPSLVMGTMRFRYVVGGTVTPSFTFSAFVQGREL